MAWSSPLTGAPGLGFTEILFAAEFPPLDGKGWGTPPNSHPIAATGFGFV